MNIRYIQKYKMMLKHLILMFFFFFSLIAEAQEGKVFYENAMAEGAKGNYEDAITWFDKSISVDSGIYMAWFNRGITKIHLGYYEDAISDFEQTLKLFPGYKKAYLNLGTAKKYLEDFNGALTYYSKAIELDPYYKEAFYNRALIYELLKNKTSACEDFYKAKNLGDDVADYKIERCKSDNDYTLDMKFIARLKKTADDPGYGFTEKNPVRVGRGPDGGPSNQITYLNLLRDQQGKRIAFERLGSCCAYKSESGVFGYALLDEYEIIYLDENGKSKTTSVFISFYEYEEPMILKGFKAKGQK